MNLIKVYFNILIPQKVDVLCGINISKVACGTQFSVALTKDGRVFTFGQGAFGFTFIVCDLIFNVNNNKPTGRKLISFFFDD